MSPTPDPTPGRSIAILGTRGYPSYYGGFETAVRHLAPFLCGNGWRVTVYSRATDILPDDPLRDDRVQVVITRGLSSKSLSTLSHGLTSTLHALRHRPDTILLMNVANGLWVPLLRARGIPVLTNVDGMEWRRAKWGAIGRIVFRLGAALSARFSTHLIYDSDAIRTEWHARSRTRGSVIAYGADLYPQLPLEPGLRSKQYVLFVARFVPENTIFEFIHAATLISKTHDVVFVGSSGYGGPADQAVKSLARDNPRVRWLGRIQDDQRLASLWQHTGAYFHGHSVGGTNPALVQAMACGAPIVARDTVYNRETLGNLGCYVQPDPQAIADAILAQLADSPSSANLSLNLVERATRHYRWQDICACYDSILRASLLPFRRPT
jgi:glycosyltransferase involved in cell wall biosynthesis